MAYLKQDEVNRKPPKKRNVEKKQQSASELDGRWADHTVQGSLDVGVDCFGSGFQGIEAALDRLAENVGRFANNAYSGENKIKLFTGEEGAGNYPVLIAIDPCSETTQDFLAIAEDFLATSQRIAKAFERIADAMHGWVAVPTLEVEG